MDPSASFKVLALGFTLLLIPSWEWLSKTSDVVLEPYLVGLCELVKYANTYRDFRTKFSTLAKRRSIALGISPTGILRLPLLLDCMQRTPTETLSCC